MRSRTSARGASRRLPSDHQSYILASRSIRHHQCIIWNPFSQAATPFLRGSVAPTPPTPITLPECPLIVVTPTSKWYFTSFYCTYCCCFALRLREVGRWGLRLNWPWRRKLRPLRLYGRTPLEHRLVRLPQMANRIAERPLVVLRLLDWVLWKYAQKARDLFIVRPCKLPTNVA